MLTCSTNYFILQKEIYQFMLLKNCLGLIIDLVYHLEYNFRVDDNYCDATIDTVCHILQEHKSKKVDNKPTQ